MEADRFRINPEHIDRDELTELVRAMKDGAVIIYPTDTVYGFGCDITKKRAVERIAALKGVKAEKSKFAMIFYDLSHISEYTKPMSSATFRMLKRALPGPYTFILEANSRVPKIFNQNAKKEVGIRVPDHLVPREIVRALGNPIVTSSVLNEEDDILEYSTDPDDLYEKFKHDVDIFIDGGFGNNIASTVIDCTNEPFEVLREGLGSTDVLN